MWRTAAGRSHVREWRLVCWRVTQRMLDCPPPGPPSRPPSHHTDANTHLQLRKGRPQLGVALEEPVQVGVEASAPALAGGRIRRRGGRVLQRCHHVPGGHLLAVFHQQGGGPHLVQIQQGCRGQRARGSRSEKGGKGVCRAGRPRRAERCPQGWVVSAGAHQSREQPGRCWQAQLGSDAAEQATEGG